MTTYTTLLNSELPVWAEDGDLEQPTSGKVATGWEAEEKPAHEYLNWVLNKHDRFILNALQEGMSVWRAGFPYVEKSLIKGSSGSIFIAKGESIDEDPEEDIAGTYWKKLIDSEGVLSAADVSAYMLNLLSSEDADEAIAELGGTAVGSAVFKAVNAEAARTAIGGSVFQDRSTHTGTQAISTVSGLQAALDAKELLSNKVITLVGANDTTFPTSKAVADAISVAASGENYLGEWNAGTLTLNITNIPDTASSKYVGYIRLVRGARKTVVFSAPAGKTWNWTSASTPTFTSTSGEYDVVMFYNQLNEAKIHAMVIDTGVI